MPSVHITLLCQVIGGRILRAGGPLPTRPPRPGTGRLGPASTCCTIHARTAEVILAAVDVESAGSRLLEELRETVRRIGPAGFQHWLDTVANTRVVRSTGAAPIDLLAEDLAGMVVLPPSTPVTGIRHRVRLAAATPDRRR